MAGRVGETLLNHSRRLPVRVDDAGASRPGRDGRVPARSGGADEAKNHQSLTVPVACLTRSDGYPIGPGGGDEAPPVRHHATAPAPLGPARITRIGGGGLSRWNSERPRGKGATPGTRPEIRLVPTSRRADRARPVRLATDREGRTSSSATRSSGGREVTGPTARSHREPPGPPARPARRRSPRGRPLRAVYCPHRPQSKGSSHEQAS